MHQHGFNLIVSIVADGDRLSIKLFGLLKEKMVAHLSGGFLDGEFVRLGKGRHIAALYNTMKTFGFGDPLHKPGLITRFGAQGMIKMGDHQRVSAARQNIHQSQTVRTPRNAY